MASLIALMLYQDQIGRSLDGDKSSKILLNQVKQAR